jgi:Transaldolase/Fructose-6-phosphate aldolase/Transketolase, C-terminal domain
MNALSRLSRLGQSCWLDDLNRRMITRGELARRISAGIHGVTSNPATFAKAIATGDYDREIEHAAAAGKSVDEIWDELAVSDIRAACDILRPIYDETQGADGFVSLEVSPHLAHGTEASIAEGRRLAGIPARVIDAYSVKPLDSEAICKAATETGWLLVVEDHALAGGLGEAVASAVGTLAPVHRLGVARLPRSGTKEQLLDYCGISRRAILALVRDIVTERAGAPAGRPAARRS